MSENLAIYRNEETRSKLLSGICDRLSSIPKPTLIITGTDDVTSPPANSVLVQKMPGAWLVQIKGGGHGAMYQYPEEFSKVLLTFLDTT